MPFPLRTLRLAALCTLAACGSPRQGGGHQTGGKLPHTSPAVAKTPPAVPSEREGSGEAQRTRVDFMVTTALSPALDRAAAEGKLVFVDFYTVWCLPCKLMEEDVFTDPTLGRYMNEHFVSVRIDAEVGSGPDLATVFGVSAYPTLLFVDPSGRVLARKEGAAYQTELRRLGDAALAAHRVAGGGGG